MNKLLVASNRLSTVRRVAIVRHYAVQASQPDDYLKKIDMKTDFEKLSAPQKMYIKRWDQANTKRFNEIQRKKKIARVCGFALIVVALSIYAYTMVAVKQEVFLDDFDVPEAPKA
jgi:hypothetical protein